MRIVCVLIGLVLGGIGCHRPLPELSRVPGYPGPSAHPVGDVDQILPGYADRVGPPRTTVAKTLDAEAVRRLVLENSPEVLLARMRVEQAQAHVESAGAWPNPELDGLYLMDPDANFISETTFRFVFPLGGRVGASQALAARELDLARLEWAAAQRQALSKVDRLLARLAKARTRLELLGTLADRSRKYAELARTRQSSSMADPLDVALVLADARTDRRRVQRQRTRVEELERQLALHAGLPPGRAEFQVERSTLVQLAETPDKLEQDAARYNSEILRSRLQVLVADQKAARAAAERAPDLQLGPAVTSDAEGVALGVSVGMPIPILQTGRGPYQEALAERGTAEEAYRQSLRMAGSKIRSAVSRHRSLINQLEELRGEAGKALEEAVQLAQVRYTSGKLDVLRLLSVHRAYSSLNLQKLDLILKIEESLIDLRDAVGRRIKVEEVKP